MTDQENPRPGEQSADETFVRLQASDPAADAATDLVALRRALDDRIDSRPVQATEIAARRTPPAARWVRFAAVAASVVLVGGAAFVAGRQTAPGSAASIPVTTSAPSSAVQEGGTRGPAGESVSGVGPATGGGGSAVASGSDAARSLVGGFGRTHFTDGGLPTAGGDAEAWGFDPGQVASAQTAERIAAAMGVSGTATVQYQAWTVGPQDGSGPSVSVIGDGIASVSYNDPQAYQWCGSGTEPGVMKDGSVAEPASPDGSCPPVVTTAITSADAISRSTEMLTSLGVDPAGYRLSSPDEEGGSGFRSVTAAQTMNGLETGQQFWFTFVGDRLASFNGGLAPMVSLGQYPVVSPARAVERMNDPRFSASRGYPIDIMPAVEMPVQPEPATDGVSVPPTPTPGAAIAWPVSEVTLVGATLGLTSQYQPDGSIMLIPAYTMTATDGGTWTVVAVADERLDFAG